MSLPYFQRNSLHFHKNRQYNSRSPVLSTPPPNFNIGKIAHLESQEVSTTLYKGRKGNMLVLL